MLKCVKDCEPLNGLGTLLCIDELRLTAPVQSYEPICGSGSDDGAATDASMVMSMRFQMLVAIAVDVMSRARCGENRVDSVGSMLIGNGRDSACG